MLLTKRTHHCTIFLTLSALMTAHPINYAILHHFSVMKDNSSIYFFPIYFGKFTKSFMSYLKPQVSFSLNFASLFNVMRDNSSALSWLKLYMIFTKGPHQSAKFQENFNCSSEFYQICTLIGSFC